MRKTQDIRYNPESFKKISKIENTHFWFLSRKDIILHIFKEYFPECKSFCEIGCGTGQILSSIEKTSDAIKLYGCDIHDIALEESRKKLQHTKLFKADIIEMPYFSQFDVAGAFDVLEHVKDDKKALSEMAKCTKENGGIIITIPQHRFLWSKFDMASKHVRRYSYKDIKQKLSGSGFRIIHKTSFVFFLFPFMVLSRILRIKNNENISPFLNNLFFKIMSYEIFLIKKGLSFPFGGSLIIAAKKI